ncbi:Hypothetical Protein FCC1311_024682 [Hondaea fermentalgiana]|uniref:Uncharacterized protein n=1 Tax=Hondaea fermentalgiana TaxID=2315210 RepID=A0A2R5G5D3_9STRA|nr:Hypothetical Protein FCC1311_024682 [Hondaea fermentalgiana]|eukprot:GBG26247.1 Hypothetical Protein FCC1311_024682 [Hondaea fermentalgiana]
MATAQTLLGVDLVMRKAIDQRSQVGEELTRRASWKALTQQMAHEEQRRSVEDQADAVRVELQRKSSFKAASRMYKEEQQRQVVLAMASDVLSELERRANAAVADEAMRKERARRIDQEAARQRAEMAERLANQSRADVDSDAEKKRRTDAGLPTEEAAFARLSWFANEVARAINKTKAVQSADAERERRIFDELRLQVASDLERKLHARTADATSEQERQRRVADSRKLEVLGELSRFSNRKLVCKLALAEQKRRVAADEDFPFGRDTSPRSNLLRKVRSYHSHRVTLKAEEEARQEYAWADLQSRVAQEVCFRVNKATALAEEEAERIERSTRATFDDYVVPTIASRGRFQDILEQVRAAQADLVAAMPETMKRRAQDSSVSSLVEQLTRVGNQRLACRLADEEKTRRTAETTKLDVLVDLVRAVARRTASHETALEASRASHARSFALVCSQAAAKARRSELRASLEQEQEQQQQQVQAAQPGRGAQDPLADVLADVERLGARRAVAAAVKEEQRRRTQFALGEDVFAGVVRAVNQREAARACDLEQHQRVARLRGQDVLVELERRVRGALAAAQADVERAEREAAMSEERVRRANSAPLLAMLEELRRERTRQEVLRSMDEEKEARVTQERLATVVGDLERYLNRLRAINEAEMERSRRVAQIKTRAVLDELERFNNRVLAADQARQEQARRIRDMDVERNRRNSFRHLYEILEQIERKYAQLQAIREAELERERRAAEEAFSQVLEELVRRFWQKNADAAMDAERVLRISQEKLRALNEEFARRVNAQAVDRAADLERLERLERLACDPTVLLDLSVSQLPRTLEELRRKASWKASKQAYEREQAVAITIDRGVAVREELLRRAALQEVKGAIEQESQRLQHVSLQQLVLEEMLREQRAKGARLAIEVERANRTSNAASDAIQFARLAATFQPQIPHAARAVQNAKASSIHPTSTVSSAETVTSTVGEAKPALTSAVVAAPIPERRAQVDGLDDLDLERAARVVNGYLASQLCDEEQARRVSQEQREICLEKLQRKCAQLEIAHAVEMERLGLLHQEQIEHEDLDDERRSNREWASFVSEEERRRRVMEADLGVTNRRPRPTHLEAVLSADCELFDFLLVDDAETSLQDAEWSELSNNLCVSPRTVRLENIISTNMRSTLEFYQEQQRRRIEGKEAELANELDRARNQRRAKHDQDLEGARRTQLRALEEALGRVERAHAVNEACAMADFERQRRVLEHTRCERISADTKRINQNKAIQEMELERLRRIDENARFRDALQLAAATSTEAHF